MRNFARINNYYNRIAAWDDWLKISLSAIEQGYGFLVNQYRPPERASWRTIDNRIAVLRAAVEKLQGRHVDGAPAAEKET